MKPLPRRYKQVNYILAFVLIAAGIIATLVMLPRLLQTWDQVQVEMTTTPTPVPPHRASVMVVTPDPNAPTPEPLLKKGTQGELVKNLQQRLQALGYYQGEVDGQFGPGTAAAVQLFQSQHGLDADGVVGSETSAILFSSEAKLVQPTEALSPTDTPAP